MNTNAFIKKYFQQQGITAFNELSVDYSRFKQSLNMRRLQEKSEPWTVAFVYQTSGYHENDKTGEISISKYYDHLLTKDFFKVLTLRTQPVDLHIKFMYTIPQAYANEPDMFTVVQEFQLFKEKFDKACDAEKYQMINTLYKAAHNVKEPFWTANANDKFLEVQLEYICFNVKQEFSLLLEHQRNISQELYQRIVNNLNNIEFEQFDFNQLHSVTLTLADFE